MSGPVSRRTSISGGLATAGSLLLAPAGCNAANPGPGSTYSSGSGAALPASQRAFLLESNFVDFGGTFAEHCHVVSHEDLEMMEPIRVT